MIVIDNLLSANEVEQFVEALALVPFNDGKETAMGMAAGVKNNGQADAQNKQVQQLANHLLSTLGSHPKVVSAALPQRIFPPCFNRYSESQTYGYHVDAAIMRIPNTADVLRSDMSMTVFLSDPDSYEGGELVIQTGFGEQSIKCAAGSAILYPSSSLHKVTPLPKVNEWRPSRGCKAWSVISTFARRFINWIKAFSHLLLMSRPREKNLTNCIMFITI